ncbi:MAG: hypothetical protein HRT44_02405 [Bdellovibrionales bacterium]|nr:hypothetical protein [Bdellovibrionales bacterium]NQZ18099.1 hypothetical protein [Bdellovibrionales bacterium]
MPIAKILLILSTLFISDSSMAQSQCSSVFAVNYLRGRLVSQNAKEEVYYVGSGIAGGSVYRIVNRETGESHLRKHYKKGPSLLNDIHALRLLAELSNGDPIVQINQPLERISNRRLAFPDVRGYNLEAHPNQSRVANEIRWFQYWALKVKDAAAERGYEVNSLDIKNVWIYYQVPASSRAEFDGLETVTIFLRPNNVILDSFTGQLVLFDPR